MSIITNLYPPVIYNSYIPAFVYNTSVKVYFSLSEFNSLNEMKNYAQVTISNQNTNLSILDSSKYPSEIMLTTIHTDNTRTTDDKYYIEITNNDINGGFQIDEYYNIQIRFIEKYKHDNQLVQVPDPAGLQIPPTTTPQALDAWLAANLDYFSEWSRLIIIRAISQPTMSVAGYEIVDGHITWSMANNNLIGTLTFAADDETEYLKDYRIKLYNSDDELLTDSGILYTDNYNNPNSFIYNFKYNFEVGESYSFTVEYETNNLYSNLTTIEFDVIQDSPDEVDFSFGVKIDENNARIDIDIKRSEDKPSYTGKLVIRRTSSESNFTIWEDMHVINLTAVTKYRYEWFDETIKSGVWYNYALQEVSVGNIRQGIKISKKPLMTIFDDVFLTTKDRQLKIKFNPTINSFKKNISEMKIETIGNKYPFIRRNGAINYVEFPISGLISFQMDEDQAFITKEELYLNKTIMKKYDKYNDEISEDLPITDANDFVYEKLFREKVMEFLYNGEVKLFRSPTEGNYLVKLLDVSFAPNQSLGRMIWSFSATATEIDEDTIDNYEKYDIIAARG